MSPLPNVLHGWLAAPLGVLLALRIGAAMFLAPGLGGRALPGRLRAVLALLLAVAVAPTQCLSTSEFDNEGWSIVWRLGPRELAIGLLLGLSVRLLVMGAACAGQLLAEMAGGSGHAGEAADNDGTGQLGALARLMEWTAIAVFLLAGGHRQLTNGVMESYVAWPLTTNGESSAVASPREPTSTNGPTTQHDETIRLVEMLVAALTRGATLAVRIAFPALIAAATTTLAAGMISRALPQMETLSWMAALVWLVVLSSIAVGMASLGTALPYELERIWELMATR